MIILLFTKDLTRQYNAGTMIKKIAEQSGSGGGGPSHFGTAGFKDDQQYKNAFKQAVKELKELNFEE